MKKGHSWNNWYHCSNFSPENLLSLENSLLYIPLAEFHIPERGWTVDIGDLGHSYEGAGRGRRGEVSATEIAHERAEVSTQKADVRGLLPVCLPTSVSSGQW